MGIFDKANYYSESNKKQGWHVEVINEIVTLNPHIITPELAEEIEIFLAPKEALINLVDNYDEKIILLKSDLDQLKMTRQESYGRSK